MRETGSDAVRVLVGGEHAARPEVRPGRRRAVVLAAYAALGADFDPAEDPQLETDLASAGDREWDQLVYVKARALARRALGDARAVGVPTQLSLLFDEARAALEAGAGVREVGARLRARAFAGVIARLLEGARAQSPADVDALAGALGALAETPTGRLLLSEASAVQARAACFELQRDGSLPRGKGATSLRRGRGGLEVRLWLENLGDPLAVARELLRAVWATRGAEEPEEAGRTAALEQLLVVELCRDGRGALGESLASACIRR